MVQFATHQHKRQESAVKFFLHDEAFKDEAAQYTDAENPLRQFLPECRDILEPGDYRCSAHHCVAVTILIF